jgi:hypothetical protein
MASEPQEKLAEVGDAVMNMPLAASNLLTMASCLQENLAQVPDRASNIPREGKMSQRSSSRVQGGSFIFLTLPH